MQAHVHARGLTADRAAAVIADQLVAAEVLEPQAEPRNASELVGQVQRAVEQGQAPPVLLVDGLDEARGEAFPIAEELLARLAPHAVIVAATRELRREDDRPSLLGVLAPGGPGLDLDDPAGQDRTRGDLADYIAARLAARDPRMDGRAVADYLAGEASMTADRPFLLARLVTDQLRASPVDTSRAGWEEQVSRSIEDAFDADLAEVDFPPHRHIDPERDGAGLARSLLAALTWGYGGGFPEEEWLAAANALSPDAGFGRDDLLWLLGQLGRYILQDGEAGVAVYRVAHQSLADHLRPAFRVRPGQLFNPQARSVTESLASRYQELLAGGILVTDPVYLWLYLWRHAADSGLAGLAVLRDLAAVDQALQLHVALAALQIGDDLQYWGQRQDAVAPTEEAVKLCHDLARDNPAYLPYFAMALTNLGNRYREVGRRQDAVAPAEEAVQLDRALAADDPAFLPDLAGALSNLSLRYREVGRRQDAVILAEEAVQLFRGLAADNPAVLPELAGALYGLGVFYGAVGRRLEAVAPAEEAVRLRHEQTRANPAFVPDLATALINLGNCYSEVGRRQDALAATEEAVRLYRDLAPANPAFLPELALALNNLGNCYSGLGRRQDAVAPTEEAVRLYRDLAPANPAFLPDLAGVLNNLGNRYSEVGRGPDAASPAEEAVQLYHNLAADNPAFLPSLAMALANLGASYSEVERRQQALAATEDAVGLYRDLAAANPAFLPSLASALTNLGNRCGDVGRAQDAVAPAGEAVRLYRGLAADNPAFLPDFAGALNNLGIRYREVGRRPDALAATEEAVQLRREQASDNPAFLPGLAGALNNLGACYTDVRRGPDAIAPTEEAVQLYRDLAPDNPAFRASLASALANLGLRYGAVDRRQDAIPPAEETVQIYRDLAHANPLFLPNLATALASLGNRYRAVGTPERGEAAWQEALSGLSPARVAFLLTARAAAIDAGHPEASRWLAASLEYAVGDRGLTAAIHEQARRHRAADPVAFNDAWAGRTGQQVPAWLTVDAGLLAAAREWFATETYDEERDFLASHPELLDPAADDAVSEALLSVSAEDAQRHGMLRQAARAEGVEAAYRPLLLTVLAQEFTEADPDTQRGLLATRRDDLLSAAVRGTIESMADEDSVAAHWAGALLALAALGEHELVLDALPDPSRVPSLLQDLACRPDLATLGPAAEAAWYAAATAEQAATVLFYIAVAVACAGEADRATDELTQARSLDPGQVTAWIDRLADIGQHHPAVLLLIPALTRPLGEAEEPESARGIDDEPC